MLPTFLVVGTQRGGTSWLHTSLALHPDVFMSEPKELGFFHRDERWARGVDWYEGHFAGAVDAVAVGESTPEYMFSPVAIERITRTLPGVRAIAVLRNPIDRAYSAFWLLRHLDHEGVSFEEAIAEDRDGLLSRGEYADQVVRLRAALGPDRVQVLISEEVRADNRAALAAVYEFVGVDPQFTPATEGRAHNAVIYPRLQDRLRSLGLTRVIDAVRGSWVGDAVRRRARASGRPSYPPLEDEVRARLATHFREPNQRLAAILGRDPGWE